MDIAHALEGMNLVPTQKDDQEKDIRVIGVMSNSRYEWAILTIASWLLNATLVPLYNTLGVEAIQHILTETKMEIVFANSKSISTILSISKKIGETIKTVICFDDEY